MQVEELYQSIGHAALRSAADLHGKVLVYAEVQPDVIEAGLFYERGEAQVVTFRYCSEALEDALYELWERWQEVPGNKPWFGLSYLIRDSKLQVDLTYPDQIVPNEGSIDRRRRLVRQHFGDVKVDYSAPGNH